MSGAALRLRLVLGHRFVAERRLGPVERNADAVGLMIAHEVQQHRREPVDRVGDLSRRQRDVGRQGEERSVRQRVPVDQHQLCHSTQPMDESRDVSGVPGVAGDVVGLRSEAGGECRGDGRTVLERRDLHLLGADGEHDRAGFRKPAQGLALAAQPQVLGWDRRVGGGRGIGYEQRRPSRGSSSCGASSRLAAASGRGTCRPCARARCRSAAPVRGSPSRAVRSCPAAASATGSTRTPPRAPAVRSASASGNRTHRSSCTDSAARSNPSPPFSGSIASPWRRNRTNIRSSSAQAGTLSMWSVKTRTSSRWSARSRRFRASCWSRSPSATSHSDSSMRPTPMANHGGPSATNVSSSSQSARRQGRSDPSMTS